MTRLTGPTPRVPRRRPPTEAVVFVALMLGAFVSCVAWALTW